MKLRAFFITLVLVLAYAIPAAAGGGGFDQYGYNYTARVFVGAADGVDRILDVMVWGDPTYANDHLVMKWSKAWDDARFHGGAWTPDAWVDNEWNGMGPDGSGYTEHVKIVWVGPCDAVVFADGGSCIWDEFEILMDQGNGPAGHEWYTKATPNGYGGR